MKTIIVTLSMIISTFLLNAQTGNDTLEHTTTITVNVPVKSDKGKVIVGLYTEENFLQNPSVGLESTIENGKASVTFKNIKAGTYAVVLFHDTNDNKQMDFEVNGMPKEMFGVSNNVMSFGPPQWSDAKFEVKDEPLVLDIVL